MKKTRKLRFMLICMVTFLILGGTIAGAASKKWTKACSAYRNYLAKNVSSYNGGWKNSESYKKTGSFQIVDLDGNGVPELIAYHANGYKNATIYIYTWKNGKVTRVKNKTKDFGGTYGISAVSSADGYYSIYKCSKKHLHLKWTGTSTSKFSWSETAYKISGGKVTEYLSKNVDKMYGKTVCKKNGKTVGNKTYSALQKKCKVKDSYYLQSNTAVNRKKFVK